MHRLVGRHREEIADEGGAHLGPEAPGHVERQIDRDELDMGKRVPQRDPAAVRLPTPAAGHPVGCEQLGFVRAPRPVRHGTVVSPVQPPQPPLARHRPRRHRLGEGIAGQQRVADRGGNTGPGQTGFGQSAAAASSTSAAWPLTLTLSHTRAIRPLASTSRVVRTMPM